MKLIGDSVVPHLVEAVWDAILDPRVLLNSIPGCEKLEAVGEHAYAMTVTAGVAAVKGTYVGRCELSNLVRHESLLMALSGSGAPGTIDAKVKVAFTRADGGGTRISYEADATVGGMVGGVGQRMLASVSKRMAGEFFRNVGKVIEAGGPGEPAGSAPTKPAAAVAVPLAASGGVGPAEPGQVFTRSAPTTAGSTIELLMGVGVGAALVIIGFALGALTRRR